jgi:plasmid stabilization system protein ParE
MSSRRLELAEDAERDIRAILRFTRAKWGERQQRDYAQLISDAMELLTRFPDLGQRRDQFAS